MNIRTDLALERTELVDGECEGVESEEINIGSVKVTRINIINETGAQKIGKPIGRYVTVEGLSFSNEGALDDARRSAVTTELSRLLPKDGTILVAGLGNSDITPDALGPKTAGSIFATRHISPELGQKLGLGDLRCVCAVSPGVLGKTGIETAEIIFGIVSKIKPAAVIAVDALASRRLSRLGTTVQLCDSGISPGSGVGNCRCEISKATLGVPVIAVGVPTVVDAATLANDILGMKEQNEADFPLSQEENMMVTPREIDAVIDHAAGALALSINCALHTHLSPEDLMALV